MHGIRLSEICRRAPFRAENDTLPRMPRLSHLREIYREIQGRLWVRIALGAWALAGAYDLTLSQFVPEHYTRGLPKTWQLIDLIRSWIPWWGWLLLLTTILIIALLERDYRRAYSPQAKQQEFTSAENAARKAINELSEKGNLWGEVAKRWISKASSVDDQIAEVARMLAVDVTPYGKPPLQSKMLPIEKFEWQMGKLTDRGSTLRKRHNQAIIASEVAFKSDDLEKILEEHRNHYANNKIALAELTSVTIPNEEAKIEAGFMQATYEKNKDDKGSAVLRLAQLRTEGVVIRNEAQSGQVDDQNFQEWSGRADKWRRDVIDVIRHVNRADSEWFSTLDVVPPARVSAPIRVGLNNVSEATNFVRIYNQHDYRLVRIEELLLKYRTEKY